MGAALVPVTLPLLPASLIPPADSANPGLRFDLQTSWGRKAVSTTVVTKRPVIYSAGKYWLLPGAGLGLSWLKAEIY